MVRAVYRGASDRIDRNIDKAGRSVRAGDDKDGPGGCPAPLLLPLGPSQERPQ